MCENKKIKKYDYYVRCTIVFFEEEPFMNLLKIKAAFFVGNSSVFFLRWFTELNVVCL